MMKVLMIEKFLPESSYTLELGEELKKYVELTIFCRRNAGAEINGIRWKKKLYEEGKGKVEAICKYAYGLLQLEKEIRFGKYDVVHAQMFKNAKYEIPIYCREKKHCGMLVHTVHNLLPHEAVESDKKLYTRFYQSCDVLVVHNEYCKNKLIEEFHVKSDKIKVIPHGSYRMLDGIGTLKSYRNFEKKTTFLQFGIIRQYKGVDILLNAISLIPPMERKNLKFIIAGEYFPKLDSTDYKAMVQKLGLEECVELRMEYIPEKELKSLFDRADFCLFPYRNIYGSGALLMAYSYGIPVIASKIPVFCEETENGETGLLFESENPQKLKEAILCAAKWNFEEYTACQTKMKNLVDEKYNWAKSAEKLWGVYQEYESEKK